MGVFLFFIIIIFRLDSRVATGKHWVQRGFVKGTRVTVSAVALYVDALTTRLLATSTVLYLFLLKCLTETIMEYYS